MSESKPTKTKHSKPAKEDEILSRLPEWVRMLRDAYIKHKKGLSNV